MDGPSDLHAPPRERLAAARDRYGEERVAVWCAALLSGRVAHDDPDSPSLTWLGGPHARMELERGGLIERGQDYWPRVWAARGLLYVWTEAACDAVCRALSDPAWRVREMAAKVVRLREIGQAADLLSPLASDATPRVRAAGVRALGVVGEAESAEAVRRCLRDPQPAVRRAADLALEDLRRRLDRPL
ncbi:MAG: HEAT repeat domain-containing protein [Stackebrandtia sp.]